MLPQSVFTLVEKLPGLKVATESNGAACVGHAGPDVFKPLVICPHTPLFQFRARLSDLLNILAGQGDVKVKLFEKVKLVIEDGVKVIGPGRAHQGGKVEHEVAHPAGICHQ